eukprot:1157745-Pelagomonas_calceolata.AAC.6
MAFFGRVAFNTGLQFVGSKPVSLPLLPAMHESSYRVCLRVVAHGDTDEIAEDAGGPNACGQAITVCASRTKRVGEG